MPVMLMRRVFVALILASVAWRLDAAPPEELFQEHVWPLLDRTCVKCHGSEKQKGGLRLDSRDAALKGGESGPALVPGKPGESLMLRLVRHPDAERDRMPPKEKLHEAEIAKLERWIAAGASWPETKVAPVAAAPAGERLGDAWSDPRNPIVKIFGGRRLDLWSLRPISDPQPPRVRDATWPRNGLDHFVLATLEKAGQKPAAEADRRTLARRLFFDLTGLPPAPEEVAAFLADPAPGATERLVDRLLASPRYGEHAARMWLDVLRYSDSNGFDWDEFRPSAWRFRDYVIRSLNADKPFDRFIRELLAGDELVPAEPRDAAEQDALIATAFLRLGPHDNSAVMFGEEKKVRQQLMADLVETTSSAFLGLTMACARCHDHKYDPISQADHYRLRAFFEAVKFRDDLPLDLASEQETIRKVNAAIDTRLDEARKRRDAALAPTKERLRQERIEKLSEGDRALLGLTDAEREPAKDKIAEIEKRVGPTDDEVKAALTREEKAGYEQADAEVQALKGERRAFTTGLVASDDEAAAPVTRVLGGGSLAEPREEVPPGIISVLDPNPAAIAKPAREKSTGRRSALAEWIVSELNPLTARVVVNRVWQTHFCEGIVATPGDFGLAGAPPSQPELLDWLAREFRRGGWSLKKLQRLIVTSATYRQAAKPRRLNAEQLRDAMLVVSGRLLPCDGGPPVWPSLPDEVLRANPAFLDDNKEKTKGWYPTPAAQADVRSLFLVQKRTVRVPLLEVFDLPENAVSCARRNVSTVAPQALTLLNSSFAAENARALAERVSREAGDDAPAQVAQLFALALQRAPAESERVSCVRFREQHSLAELCRAVLNLNEFVYLD